MDPGNWATDLAGGSQFGYSLLWVLLMSNLMAILLQSLSARLGRSCPARPVYPFPWLAAKMTRPFQSHYARFLLS